MGDTTTPEPQFNRAGRRAEHRRLRKTGALMAAIPAAFGTTAMVVGAAAGPAGATELVVKNLNATGADSLRDLAEGANDGDVIVFQAGLTGTIPLEDQIDIDTSITIQGPGRDVITVSGGGTVRIFEIDAPSTDLLDVRISGLTLTEGSATRGAAVDFDYANVTLDDVLITGNSVGSAGGGVATDNGYDQVLTITNSTITGNTAEYRGGGVYFYAGGSLVMGNTDVTDNSAGSGGGGIWVGAEDGTQQAQASITGSRITGNVSDGEGGGLYGYYLSNLTITDTRFSDNHAYGDGGGGIVLFYVSQLTISGSTIVDNTSAGYGGGLYTSEVGPATITSSTFAGNVAGEGGGAIEWYSSDGPLEIRNSTLSGNSTAAYGGAIYVASSSGPVSIYNSTISGNTADAEGGAISFEGYDGLTIIQSTISQNTGATIGGIAIDVDTEGVDAKDAKAAKATERAEAKAAGKVAQGKEAGPTRPAEESPVRTAAADPIVLSGAIVTLNSGIDIGETGTVQASGSLLGTISGTTLTDQGGNQFGVDPLLGPLQDNGGPTFTHALLDGSPAINAGPDPVATFPGNADDQRGPGYPRVIAGRVDIGAFEVQPSNIEPDFTG